jgi:hypothetical protein
VYECRAHPLDRPGEFQILHPQQHFGKYRGGHPPLSATPTGTLDPSGEFLGQIGRHVCSSMLGIEPAVTRPYLFACCTPIAHATRVLGNHRCNSTFCDFSPLTLNGQRCFLKAIVPCIRNPMAMHGVGVTREGMV